MDKTTRIIIITLISVFIGGIICLKMPKNSQNSELSNLDPYTIYSGSDLNGNISDHIKGNPNAKIILYEYADYQCPGCASVNPWINELIEGYEGKIGLVYRSYLLSYHANARAAAASAEAAGLQGYWKAYADLLFANQSEWEGATASTRGSYFNSYFETASKGEGDLEKFQSDLKSEAVSKKIDFDVALAKSVNIEATPALYLDGEPIDWYEQNTKTGFLEFMRNLIDEKLAKIESE